MSENFQCHLFWDTITLRNLLWSAWTETLGQERQTEYDARRPEAA